MSTEPSPTRESPPYKPGGVIVSAYALSIAAMSAVAGLSMSELGPLWAAAAGYLAATLVIYGYSLAFAGPSNGFISDLSKVFLAGITPDSTAASAPPARQVSTACRLYPACQT